MHTVNVFSPNSLTNTHFQKGCCALIGNCPGLSFFNQEETIPRGKENGMKVPLVYGLHLGERDHNVWYFFSQHPLVYLLSINLKSKEK